MQKKHLFLKSFWKVNQSINISYGIRRWVLYTLIFPFVLYTNYFRRISYFEWKIIIFFGIIFHSRGFHLREKEGQIQSKKKNYTVYKIRFIKFTNTLTKLKLRTFFFADINIGLNKGSEGWFVKMTRKDIY